MRGRLLAMLARLDSIGRAIETTLLVVILSALMLLAVGQIVLREVFETTRGDAPGRRSFAPHLARAMEPYLYTDERSYAPRLLDAPPAGAGAASASRFWFIPGIHRGNRNRLHSASRRSS